MRLSVVIEWDNARVAAAPRAVAMLRELATQLRELALAGPPQIIVVFDPRQVDGARLADVVGSTLGVAASVSLVEGPGARYYELKNRGAERAGGDVVVFLDSDVIPDPGWLRGLVEPLARGDAEVVGGDAYIVPESLYARAFALSWFLPLPSTGRSLEPVPWFFANNVAVHRSRLGDFRFPAVDGAARLGCRALARTLASRGVVVYRCHGARVRHPTPHGAGQFVGWALSEGRDHVVGAALARGPARAVDGVRNPRAFRGLARRLGAVLTRRREVGLPLLAVPPALALAGTYYALYATGASLTLLLPGVMRRRLQR